MSAPYSYDLRTKAIEAVKRGERKIAVCRLFNISRNTLDLWLKREEQTGDYQAITGFQKEIGIKSPIGTALRNLSKSMAARPKGKWQSCGGTM